RAVFRPLTAPGRDLAHRPPPGPKTQPHLRPHCLRIARRPSEAHPQSSLASHIVVEFGLRPVLRHHQVHTPVPVIITERRATLFAENPHSTLSPRNSLKIPAPVTAQPQAKARVVSRRLGVHLKEILAQEDI